MDAGQEGLYRVGCSGWSYKHWRGPFYPQDAPSRSWFSIYAQVLDTVEINNTFYQLPERSTFVAWRKQAPEGFLYAVKANRYLTHVKRLKDVRGPVRRFLDRARLLEGHLGPVLYQLPPRWHVNPDRLKAFLDLLPDDLTHVFEFRDETWFCGEVYGLLEEAGAAFCTHDMPGMRCPRVAVGPAVYVRFHGTEEIYGGEYSAQRLGNWARWITGEMRGGRRAYAYFNNDAEGRAPHDARKLLAALRRLKAQKNADLAEPLST